MISRCSRCMGSAIVSLVFAACAKENPVQPSFVATSLVFTGQPPSTHAGSVIAPAIRVSIEDANGNVVSSATTAVTLALAANSAGATLTGTATVSAVAGVATFSALSIAQMGSGFTFTATAAGLTGATSTAFDVTAPTVAVTYKGLSSGTSTCGITPSGAAYCWGSNLYGELGGAYSDTLSAVPVAVLNAHVFAAIGVGSYGACGAAADGTPYCWGLGSNTGLTLPVQGGLGFSSIALGGVACGLTATGTAYCWSDGIGNNGAGLLGNGSTSASLIPVLVSGELTFASLSTGSGAQTCGVTTTGAAYCWGNNKYGQLGDDATANSLTPTVVATSVKFSSISVSAQHTCGVTTAGDAYCWGANSYGQLGTGSTTASLHPVAVSGGLKFASIATGSASTCGVTTSGAAYCWGSNASGQLGNGTTIDSQTPVAVAGGIVFSSIAVGTNAAGGSNTFACGVATSGAAYCWGTNTLGQLGNGTKTDSSTPVAVSGGLHFGGAAVR